MFLHSHERIFYVKLCIPGVLLLTESWLLEVALTFPISKLRFIVKATQLSDDSSLAKPMLPASHLPAANLSLMVSFLVLATFWLHWLSTEHGALCQLVVSSPLSTKTTDGIFEYPKYIVSKISFSNLLKYRFLWRLSLAPCTALFVPFLNTWAFLKSVSPRTSLAQHWTPLSTVFPPLYET